MIKGNFPIEKFNAIETPFYFYDIALLRKTLETIQKEIANKNYHVHYAIKANANARLLKEISSFGFGADCVSGNEVLQALSCGIDASKIVFAGVGKTDREIQIGLNNDIFCFNVESIPELEVIEELAAKSNKTASVAIRINPNIDGRTHKYITTGLNENKFGLNMADLPQVLELLSKSNHIKLIGLHFHIGSQITDLSVFQDLCIKVKEVETWFDSRGIFLPIINVGGGLGINYHHPNHCPMADFESYFRLFDRYLALKSGQSLHFELGRSVVASCGSLISRVTYVKKGIDKTFLILDAGMSELIRPALYHAFHHIENLTSDNDLEYYDIVGPICESADIFAEKFPINQAKRGDIIAVRSAGAYGEVMASSYNCRPLNKSFFSDSI